MRCKNVQEVARLRPRHPCHLFSEEPGRRREAAMAVSKAALVLLVLSLVSSAYGIIPTALDCADGLTELGLDELTAKLTPCAFGSSPNCCNNLNPIFKLGASSTSAGCLCNELLLEEIVTEIVSNELAAAVGFDGPKLKKTFQDCGTSFFGGIGPAWCPAKSQRINFSQDDITDIQEAQAAAPGPLQIKLNAIRTFFSFGR